MMTSLLQTLELVFGWLLAASWQASVLALFVVVVQAIFGARLNPRWRYALWLLVLARLVLPVLPESALSLFQFAPRPPMALQVKVSEPLFVHAPVLPVPGVASEMPMVTHPFSAYSLLAIIWLAGAVGLMVLTWVVNQRFARQVADSPEISDAAIVKAFAEAKAELGIRRAIRLIENGQVQSPAIMGLFRPALLLPADVQRKFDATELRLIFLHELAHLKRGDVFVQALIAVLQILHWFNPVLWLAFRRMRIDREPATDALVLSRAGEAEKERYGLMLIKLLEHFNQRHSLPTLVGILEEKDQFKQRFSLIAKFTRGAYGWSLLGVIIIAALAVVCLTKGSRGIVRDPVLPYAIDLKPFYTQVFRKADGSDSRYHGFGGPRTVDGLPFNVDGESELFGQENADRNKPYPETISGIKIGRKFDELHVIHAAEWREYYGCPVATLRLHYADGTQFDFPVRFDFQVNDWSRLFTEDAELVADPETKIIWRGAGGALGTGRLFKSVVHNPFPAKQVDTMDVLSTGSGVSYLLVAATVAQSDPDRTVTPPMPLLPSRNFDGTLNVHVIDGATGAPVVGAEVYPAMVIGDISLVADNVLTGPDGIAPVKYPKSDATDLRVKVAHANYVTCEDNWQNGWERGNIPPEVTYQLKPAPPTDANAQMVKAVRKGDAATVQKLVNLGVDPNEVEDQKQPLIFAAASPEVAELLLQHGANPNARNSQKDAVLAYILRNRRSAATGIAEVLLKHGADPNSRSGELGETPLMDAQDGAAVDLLIEHGADIHLKMNDGGGVMDFAPNHALDCFQALLRHGVPFDAKKDGPTILLRASWISNLPIMQEMIDRKVDPNVEGVWAMVHGKPDLMLPITAAAVDGQLKAAKFLLAHGARADDQMVTAMHNGNASIVKLFWESGVRSISELSYLISQKAPVGDLQKLLDAGAPADPPQDKQITPLGEAARMGDMDAVKLLIAHHADVNGGGSINPKVAKLTRTSPIWLAASEGQDEVVTYLLAQGAKPEPEALWQAAENSYPYQEQRTKDHFEKTVRILLDAGATKDVTPEMAGMILAAPLGTRQGPPNATVLKMLLDAGLSPEVPMPYIVANGEKPNSVIGYYREYYQKYKDDPVRGSLAATIKPLLDMLEAAEKRPATTDTTSSWPPADLGTSAGFSLLSDTGEVVPPKDAALNEAMDKLSLGSMDVTNMAMQDFLPKLARLLKKENPDSPQISFYLMVGHEDTPYSVSFHLEKKASLRAILNQVNAQYPIRFQIRGADDIVVWQVSHFETAFNTKARETKIDVDLAQVDLRTALKIVEDAAAGQGLSFQMDNLKNVDPFVPKPAPVVTLKRAGMTVDEAMRYLLGLGHLRLAFENGRYLVMPAQADVPVRAVTTNDDQVEIECKVAEVREEVYQANREKIDAAVKAGDIGYLNTLKGMSLLSAPSVTTQVGEKATVDVVRALAFPLNFEKGKDGKFTPTEFTTRNCGISATLTATEKAGKVQVAGTLSLTTFEGFTFNGESDTRVGSPTFRTTESYVFEEMDRPEQIKGMMIPGIQQEPPAEEAGTPMLPKEMEGTPNRLMVLLSAKRVK